MTSHLSRTAAAAAATLLLLAACSNDSALPNATTTTSTSAAPSETSAPSTSDTAVDDTAVDDTEVDETTVDDTAATGDGADRPGCEVPTEATTVEALDLGDDRDWDITSFDGATIRAHWFPVEGSSADAPAPTILMGPGWSQAGDVDTQTVGILGAISIRALWDEGYNVLTWDPRGFGESTGVVQINSAGFEGRDVQQLIEWVAGRPEAQVDAPRDPRMGMLGASYGGGIQLVAAGIDCRVDAIVPIVAWNSLRTSLNKGGVAKTGWGNLLTNAAAAADLDPTIVRASEVGNTTGAFDEADIQWFEDRGPGDLVSQVFVPTLLIHGTVDTLFTLDEAVTNFRLLQQAETTTAMIWFCGGHGTCLTDEGDPTRITTAALAWLDRYVRGNTETEVPTGVELVDQNGDVWTADDLPDGDGTPVTATGSGELTLEAGGGAGPATADASSTGIIDTLAMSITPGRATNSVDVVIDAPSAASSDGGTLVVGAPVLSLAYSGTVQDGTRPTAVFAQIVDDTTGVVLGNQITPVPLVLDGTEQTTELPLEWVSHLMTPGTSVTLQIVATTVAYAEPRLGGSVTFTDISISLPTTTEATRLAS